MTNKPKKTPDQIKKEKSEYSKAWYAANRERAAQTRKNWYERNREFMLQYMRDWRKANPHKTAKYQGQAKWNRLLRAVEAPDAQ